MPDSCSSLEGQLVKVIVLPPEATSNPIKTNIALFKLAGIAQGTGESIAEKHDDFLVPTLRRGNVYVSCQPSRSG